MNKEYEQLLIVSSPLLSILSSVYFLLIIIYYLYIRISRREQHPSICSWKKRRVILDIPAGVEASTMAYTTVELVKVNNVNVAWMLSLSYIFVGTSVRFTDDWLGTGDLQNESFLFPYGFRGKLNDRRCYCFKAKSVYGWNNKW